MKELILKKGVKRTRVMIYNEIEQLPITRFMLANKYWMLHDSIGSSIEDFDKNHYSKFALIAGEKEKCLKELANFRILVFNIMNENNVQHLSFACLIHSVNGVEITDLSEENLRNVLKDLSNRGLTQAVLKKKLRESGKMFTKN